MAIPVVERFSVGEAENALSVTAVKPTDTAQNELLLALHGADGSGSLTEPSGFTLLSTLSNGSAIVGEVSHKIAGASEPADYSASRATVDDQILGLLRISGVDTAAPIHASATDTGNSATPTAPGLTTTAANCLIVHFYVGDSGDLVTEDAGYPTDTVGIFNRETETPSIVCAGAARENKAVAGLVPSRSFELASAEQWVAWTIAIAENVSAGPGGIKLGTTTVDAIRLGTTVIDRVYEGDKLVWPAV